MMFITIVAGGLAVGAVAWCWPRESERRALAGYPMATRLRILAPFVPWQEAVAPPDRAAFTEIRSRVRVVGVPVLIVSVCAIGLSAVWPTATPPQQPAPIADQPVPVPIRVIERAAEPIAQAEESVVDTKPSPPSEPAIEFPTDPEHLKTIRAPAALYGTAKVHPVYRQHDVEGARITKIDPNSFWAMLGVREGDVVIELNGQPVDDPAVLIALMNALERDDDVALAVRGTDDEVRYLEFEDPN